uniref:CRAL-TRIO domain-containing protein n=1 Tax=Haptolina ericina TaxID=156174 RepID=A0A7S3ADV5_9EUKA
MYVHGFDHEGRSIITFNVSRHTTSSPWYDKQRMLCAVIFVIEQAMYESKHSAQQFVLVCNLRGFGRRNFDQFLIGRSFRIILQDYPGRMGACLLWNGTAVFNTAWEILKTWIPQKQSRIFHRVADEKSLAEFLDPSLVTPDLAESGVGQASIARYLDLSVGHLRHARGASSSLIGWSAANGSGAPVHKTAKAAPPAGDESDTAPLPVTASLGEETNGASSCYPPLPPSPRLGRNGVEMASHPAPPPPGQERLEETTTSAERDPPTAGATIRTEHAAPVSAVQAPHSAPSATLLSPSGVTDQSPKPRPSISHAEDEGPTMVSPSATSVAAARAEAVEYVDMLLASVTRSHTPEEDVRQAQTMFDEAKKSNGVQDYKAASSYFETSFRLHPKLTTLISTANMYLKLRKPAVAAEIYTRLLQGVLGVVPQREKEVVLRKLASCKTMLSEEDRAAGGGD